MSKVLLEKITENLETVFRGDAWHGPSVTEITNSLPAEVVDKKQGSSKKTIAQLIFHMVAWRKFILAKLDDSIHFSLATEEDNWGTAEQTSAANWKMLLAELSSLQNQIIERLEELDDDLLDRQVPGEYYNFYTLLNGLIQHDTYHLGMIWVVWE